MAVVKLNTFGGIAPTIPPRYLQDNQAQTALNCPMWNGSLQPLPDVGSAVYTLTKSGVPQTIYRFGQDTVADDRYWFHWPVDVDVVRSQIAGDASEWTFYTGDGVPKQTYNSLALASGDYPSVSRPLGLPAPTDAATVTLASFSPESHAAEVVLTRDHIEQLTTNYGVLISVDEDDAADYVTISLTGTITADSVTTAINNSSLSSSLTAEETSGSVTITTTTTGTDAKLFVKFQTGTETDLEGDFTPGTPNISGTGTTDTDALLIITDAEIGSISSGDRITLITEDGDNIDNQQITSSGTIDATYLRNWLSNRASGLTINTYGSCVVIEPNGKGDGADGFIQYKRKVGSEFVTNIKSSGSESAAPARIFVEQSDVDDMEGDYLRLRVNGRDSFVSIPETAYVNNLVALNAYGVTVELYGAIEPFAVISTNTTGSSAELNFRGGTYPTKAIYSLQTSEGYVDEDESTETRVYTWTWVNKEGGFSIESAPAPASNGVDVRAGQNVNISGLQDAPGGEYVFTDRRIYRSVNGIYLFVKEIPAANTTFIDDVDPDELGEELPTLNWAAPPSNLKGLTNLPNGLMAGFVGRDVYFCDPYHPYAWPEEYIQTIDYPIVGFGRMDTTLAVLTTGVPYFIQGTHPTTMAVTKSDLQQACVSKRSIVSHGGAVFYAAPDGLMMLSPSGSKIVTENLFSYDQWQSYFKPESIHAYQHDSQYIAFYDNGTTQGGFIFDMRTGQIITHDIYAEAGFQDLQRDKLFLAFSDRSLKVWGQGSTKSYTWKSKLFTQPQEVSFSCGQLEAESYPMTMKIYADGNLIHTQTVQNRNPFRLPAKRGRDWEFQVEGSNEVFSAAIATSMTELANG